MTPSTCLTSTESISTHCLVTCQGRNGMERTIRVRIIPQSQKSHDPHPALDTPHHPHATILTRTLVHLAQSSNMTHSTLTVQHPNPVEGGWDSPTQGPKGRSRAERISRKGPASQSWNGSRSALDRAQRARRAGVFKKLSEDPQNNVTLYPDTGRAPSTSQPAPPSACQKGLTRHSSLFTIHYSLP